MGAGCAIIKKNDARCAMYKISVPLMNHTVTPDRREKYLDLLKRAKCDRVFLAFHDYDLYELDLLADNIKYFKENGFEACIWMGCTVGHGGVLLNGADKLPENSFKPMINVHGAAIGNANCPLDKNFIDHFSDVFQKCATAKPDLILLDDDFRLSLHNASTSRGFCCTCDAHLERISKYCGETVKREDIMKLAFRGSKNKYRDAWLKAQSESLYEAAEAWRAAVDKVDPTLPMAYCSVYCHWDVDGVDAEKLTRILAGKGNAALLRTQGAPYWAVINGYSLIGMIEISRMFAVFSKYEGIELMSEGDVYPRPRYNIPASVLEIFDGAMRADGAHHGILKYMFDYSASPDFEDGYLLSHEKNQPIYEKIGEFFKNGANEGVRILLEPHTLSDADLDLASLQEISPMPWASVLLASCSVPTIYEGEGICTAAFGESAKKLTKKQLAGGTIVDATGAIYLQRSGIDVGLDSEGEFFDGTLTVIHSIEPEERAVSTKGVGRFLLVSPNKQATPALYATIGGERKLLAYTYENADGERFLVYLFEAMSFKKDSGLFRGYAEQLLLQRVIPWLSGKELPIVSKKNPELYTICERGEDGSLSVGLFNCFADSVLYPTFELDREYKRVECAGCEAVLDGKTLTLKSELGANKFAALRLS